MKFYKISTVILILVFGFTKNAASQPFKIDSVALKLQAQQMLKAFSEEDYKTFVRFTYPKLVELLGGSDKMTEFLKQSVQGMKSEGYTFDTISIGAIQKSVIAGKEMHVLLPQELVLKTENGTLTSNSYLLAISTDGSNWYFVDAGNFTPEKLKLVFPEYNYDLEIPKKRPPVFLPQQ